jgi:hypothetical protein
MKCFIVECGNDGRCHCRWVSLRDESQVVAGDEIPQLNMRGYHDGKTTADCFEHGNPEILVM